jgi:23S rRNA pseudouridine2605 synthase
MQSGERLQKAIANLGLASRRVAEAWIKAGRLSVNGEVATLGLRVRPDDQIRLDGRLVRRKAPGRSHKEAYIGHRSPAEAGDFRERLPKRKSLRYVTVSPMPRIDGGLEIFVSDGSLAALLQRRVRRLAVEFSVRVRGELQPDQLEAVRAGILDDGTQLHVEEISASGGEGANRWYVLRALGASGKEVRQLFERQGAIVSRIIRTRLGMLALERSLARGYFRPLTEPEIESLVSQSNDRPVTPRPAGPKSAT